jgi:hypothetical protein
MNESTLHNIATEGGNINHPFRRKEILGTVRVASGPSLSYQSNGRFRIEAEVKNAANHDFEGPESASSRLSEFWRSFFESYDSVWNDLPRCFGAYKNVPANLDVRISIRTAKRHSVNSSLKYAAEC